MKLTHVLGGVGLTAVALSSAYASTHWSWRKQQPKAGTVVVRQTAASNPYKRWSAVQPKPTPTPVPTPTPTAVRKAAAAPVAAASTAVRQSVAIGNDPAMLTYYQKWLGRQPDAVTLFGGFANWSDWQTSPGYLANRYKGMTSDILWSIPLIVKGATLDEAARGGYDSYYRQLAQTMVNLSPNDQHINVRVGWEFNGNGWFPWSAVGKAEQYKGAFRHFVAAFRSVAPKRFVFEWAPNVGNVGMDPSTAYPGDDVVDIISMDFYWDTKWLGTDPAKAWNTMVTQKWGLQWHQDFAKAHNKPTAYSEWGVNSNTAGPYIQSAAKWFEDHHVLFQGYWNNNSAFRGDLSHGQYPNAAATFKSTFGAKPLAGPVPLAGK
jgi:hypothetical protein